jgi:hypothetical protein
MFICIFAILRTISRKADRKIAASTTPSNIPSQLISTHFFLSATPIFTRCSNSHRIAAKSRTLSKNKKQNFSTAEDSKSFLSLSLSLLTSAIVLRVRLGQSHHTDKTATPLSYILQAAMGQCSTLPAEGRSAASAKGREGVPFRREESLQKDKLSHRPSHSRKGSSLQVQNQQANMQVGGQFDDHLQSRNPETRPELMEEDHPREGIPQPPDVATRTRCYKLNLDSEIQPQSPVYLGPYTDVTPPLTFSASSDSSVDISQTQVAITTATIFRGITVGKDGTILSQNARATRSNRNVKKKRGEKSRQASKIEKARDLVEETILTGKAPDSDEPANMLSIVVMGEYDDMKYLVRDGSKKLRESTELPEDSLVAVNHHRGPRTDINIRSPRKRVAALQTPNKLRSLGLPQSAPPKLKGNARDRPSSRKHADDRNRNRDNVGFQGDAERSPQNVGEGDWSNTLGLSRGFHSIWNCGGAGEDTGTASPTQFASPRDGKSQSLGGGGTSPYRPVFEGRDSNFGQVRETGVATRN